jgi:hypothetical protein
MSTRKRSGLCTTLERALYERDRREIASVERLLKAFRIEPRHPKPATAAQPRKGR